MSTILAKGKGLNCDSGGSIYGVGVIALGWEWKVCAFPVLPVQSWHNIAHKHLITRGGSEGSIFNYHK